MKPLQTGIKLVTCWWAAVVTTCMTTQHAQHVSLGHKAPRWRSNRWVWRKSSSQRGGWRKVYQNIDGLVDRAFGDNVLDPGLVHIHGPAVLEDRACCVEVLGTVHLVGTIKEKVSRLVGHSWGTTEMGNWEVQNMLEMAKSCIFSIKFKLFPLFCVCVCEIIQQIMWHNMCYYCEEQEKRKNPPRTSADFFLSMIWMSHDPSGIWVIKE